MLCEICGEREAVTEIEMEGLVLRVCRNCAKFGREITKETERAKNREKRRTGEETEDVLPDYAEKVRKAREKKGMSRKELAMLINEKLSVIEKIEAGKMLPDKKLTKKLEKVLDIRITGAVDSGKAEKRALPEVTLGDVAKVRVK